MTGTMLPHCEAVTRPSMGFVSAKSEQPQQSLILHRSRQLLVRQRTMLSNAIRGHMAELVTMSKGRNGTAELLEVMRMRMMTASERLRD
jgi:transposase